MVIKKPTPRDRPKIRRLFDTRDTFNEKEIKVAMEVFDEAFSLDGDHGYQVYCCYDDQEHLAGYICFGLIPVTDTSYDLYWVVVDRKHEREGIGSRLLTFAERLIARQGGEKIYIETSNGKPYEAARIFYEKQGYEIVSIMKDFYRRGDHKLTYVKEVTSIGE
jgi:ribosomal protein S18 acetylase RimI-like enzyme